MMLLHNLMPRHSNWHDATEDVYVIGQTTSRQDKPKHHDMHGTVCCCHGMQGEHVSLASLTKERPKIVEGLKL
jgi:hypothetical protein